MRSSFLFFILFCFFFQHCKDHNSLDGRNENSSSTGGSSTSSSNSLSDNVNIKTKTVLTSATAAISPAPTITVSDGKNQIVEINETKRHRRRARSLRNTFGWMRIEILTMLIAGIFLGAFCFSLIIEAMQTLIHISHKDAMHYPVAIFTLAVGGLILNAFCYLLIGGYTHHQASFRRITPAGDVVLDQMANRNGLVRDSRRVSTVNADKDNDCNQINVITQSNGSSIQIDVPAPSTAVTALATVAPHIPTSCITLRRRQTLIEFIRDISSKFFF